MSQKPALFPVDKTLEKPERVMLVGVMLSADYAGANETRERAFQAAQAEAGRAIRRWEPRCQLMSVKPAVDGEHLTLRVSWKGSDGQPRTQELLWR